MVMNSKNTITKHTLIFLYNFILNHEINYFKIETTQRKNKEEETLSLELLLVMERNTKNQIPHTHTHTRLMDSFVLPIDNQRRINIVIAKVAIDEINVTIRC